MSESIPRLKRCDAPLWGGCVALGYVLAVAAPVVMALSMGFVRQGPALMKLGRVAGLLGFAMLALQVALTSRVRMLSRPFGLDRLTRFHKWTGITACLLLLAHPFCFAVAHRSAGIFTSDNWKIHLGLIALAVLVLGVLFALMFRSFFVGYGACASAARDPMRIG